MRALRAPRTLRALHTGTNRGEPVPAIAVFFFEGGFVDFPADRALGHRAGSVGHKVVVTFGARIRPFS